MKTIRPLSFMLIILTAFSTITHAQEASTELANINTEISDTNRANLDEFINHIESSLGVLPVTEPSNLAVENQNATATPNNSVDTNITTQNRASTDNKTVTANATTVANNSISSETAKTATVAPATTTSNKATNNEENTHKNKISVVEILQLGASLASLLLSAYL